MSNSHAKSAAAFGRRHGGRRVSRLGKTGPVPSQAEGRSAEVAPPTVHATAVACASLGEGTQRPSALRAAFYGLPGSIFPLTARFQHWR